MRTRKTRLRVSGALITTGVVVEAVSLRWSHPTAFFLFALVSGACFALGMLLFLWTALRA
jgi:hypothetical protein